METLQGLTEKAIESGIKRLKALQASHAFIDYPPNCLQFKALCLAFYEELKLPKASVAYLEIKNKCYISNGGWTHKAVKYIACHLPEDFWNEQESRAYTIFHSIYEEVCNLVRQGHEIPECGEPQLKLWQGNKDVAFHYLNLMREQLGALQ